MSKKEQSFSIDRSQQSFSTNEKTDDLKSALSQPLMTSIISHKKTNYKHESYKQHASVNDTASFNSQPVGIGHMMEGTPDVQIDESIFHSTNTQAYESLKKIKQSQIEMRKSREITERAFICIDKRDKNGLMRIIDQNPSIPITDMIDHRGYTLLHMICFKNLEAMAIEILDKVKKTITQKHIQMWINLKTGDDGFAAIHFASFRGNLKIITLLLENGADMHLRNNFGINVLHVAAQGDQPLSLYFFKEKGIDLRSKDNRNSTPLHWACYSKSELALCYLLAWVDQLDEQDVDGFTPLHLAIKSVETLRSTRPVRSLLIRGASRKIIDNQGSKPIDLVEGISILSLQQELRQMLKEPKSCSCFMIKTPLKKMSQSSLVPIFFLLLIIINIVLLCLFSLPFMNSNIWFYVNITLFFITLFFFALSSVKDPGYLTKPNELPFLNMIQNFDPVLLCPDCQIIRTYRSRHCSICNKCVERFDHHCPWINNCVGINNHQVFLLFLCSLTVLLISVITTASFNLYQNTGSPQNNNLMYFLPLDTYQEPVFFGAVCINLVTSCFFIIPVLLLTIIQLKNFCMNKTTNERFAKRANSIISDASGTKTQSMISNQSTIDGLYTNYNNKSIIQNCYSMCFNKTMLNQKILYDEHVNNMITQQQKRATTKTVTEQSENSEIESENNYASKQQNPNITNQ